jgi:hypothetical protein
MVHTEKLYAAECMRFDICQALDILDEAKDLPSHYYANCYGVLLLSSREVGVLVSGTAGSGLLLSHDPLAKYVEFTLVGQASWNRCQATHWFRSQGHDCVLPVTRHNNQVCNQLPPSSRRTHRGTNHWGHKESKEQHHQTTTFCFSSGIYYGVELEGVVIKSNIKRHRDFYGDSITPRQILMGSNKTQCNERSGVQSLHDELIRLAQGQQGAGPPDGDGNDEDDYKLLSSPSSCCRSPLTGAATGVQQYEMRTTVVHINILSFRYPC